MGYRALVEPALFSFKSIDCAFPPDLARLVQHKLIERAAALVAVSEVNSEEDRRAWAFFRALATS